MQHHSFTQYQLIQQY